jgi:hypothetical protein
MKLSMPSLFKVAMATAAAVAYPQLCSGADSSKTAPATSRTNSPAAQVPLEIPQSVYSIPASSKEGRNPFFPNSTPVAPVVPPKEASQIDPSVFNLNGITSPPKRTAMINGRTFEPGESGEVKLANGSKIMIKCEEVRADSAIISVGGQRKELKFRTGL